MHNPKLFSKEIKEKFENINNKFYNMKYALDLINNTLEYNTEVPIQIKVTVTIFYDYFLKTKDEYNALEEELGVLI